ncbi:MAG: HAD family hydrolase [Clostridiales bacterium]|nr:HAD family hydrolase [Clostridiales bacterium]
MKNYILFDLDGTLLNPKEGITKSIQYALKHMGIEVENLDSLSKFIGPPLRGSFRDYYNFNEEEVELAMIKYREYFSVTGLFENTTYPDIEEMLQHLQQGGKKLILATSKPEVFAKQIMDHFHLAQYFEDICGSTMDASREKKGDVIRYALNKNKITDMEQVVMIGDRKHDIIGAKENDMDSIGVLYGFGDRQELLEAGADHIVETAKELETLLLKGLE